MNVRLRVPTLLLLALAATASPARADDAFLVTNPATGKTESIWSAVPPGGSSQIFFSVLEGNGWTPSEQLTADSTPDSNPHLAFNSQGDRYAVWWRDDSVDGIYFATKPVSGGSWSAPILISASGENARYPRIAIFQGDPFVVYETVPGSGNREVHVSRQDSPDPWASGRIATSGQTGQLLVRIHQEAGHLWVDWVDSESYLGWSEFVSGSWTAAAYEAYSGQIDIDAGRGRIRSNVLN